MDSDKQLSIEKIFDAPREAVFKAWSSAGHVKNWYTPGSCSVTIYKLDFIPGGIFQQEIRSADGQNYIFKGEYLEIIENEKIVYVLHSCDEKGNLVSDSDAKTENSDETIVTIRFEDYDGKTKLTLSQTVPEKWAKEKGSYQGWLEILDNLEKKINSHKIS